MEPTGFVATPEDAANANRSVDERVAGKSHSVGCFSESCRKKI